MALPSVGRHILTLLGRTSSVQCLDEDFLPSFSPASFPVWWGLWHLHPTLLLICSSPLPAGCRMALNTS